MALNELNIIYDISVLGMGTRSPAARTGVFRIIESLLDELLECPDIHISFNASPYHLDAACDYLQQKGLIHPGRKIDHRSGTLLPLVKYLPNWFRYNLPQVVNLTNGSKLYADQYAKADIFHTPWLPIPPAYETEEEVKKFITVHDLIPIIFPDFVTEDNVVQFMRILKSITPDTWVLCNSHSTRNDLLNYHKNIDPEKVFVTHWAASSLFRPIHDESLISRTIAKYNVPDAPYILSLSTIEPRKNIKTLLQAFRELIVQEKIKDLNLVLVGTKGWKYQEIIDFIDSNPEITSRVFFTGYIDDNDLAAVYSGAMAFVYPSYYEGFGLPPLEAMQCGVPVICSNTSSLPEVVGDAGILIDPKKIEDLIQSIFRLCADDDLRKEVSDKSVAQANRYTWKSCVNKTISIYKYSVT